MGIIKRIDSRIFFCYYLPTPERVDYISRVSSSLDGKKKKMCPIKSSINVEHFKFVRIKTNCNDITAFN